MIFIEFPIMDPMRKYLILMEWIFIFLSFELGIIFIFKYRKSIKESVKNLQELSYSILFFSYGLQWTLYIFSDYYAPIHEIRTIILAIAYFTLMIGALIFIFIIEIQKRFIKKYFFTVSFSSVILIFAILTILDISYAQPVSYITSPVFIIFFFYYVIDLSKKSQQKGTFIRHFLKFSLGFVTLAIGYLLTTDFITSMFGLVSRLIGDIIQIVSIGFIYLFFSTLPPLSEFDWYEKIDSVYLLNRAGICIYEKNFTNVPKTLNQQLIASGLASINIVLESITKTTGISIIKKQNFTTFIYPGEQLAGILICTEELNSLKELLKTFVEKTESVYMPILKKWDGELNIFKPIEDIFNNIFRKI